MTTDAIICAAIEYIKKLFHNDASGHDTEHSLRVYRNALAIAKEFPDCDVHIISLAALLHDADDYKLFHTKANANARTFLADQNIPQEQIEQICQIINEVSFSKNRGKRPSSIEGMIVQDADRLDALGAIGIARTFAFGGSQGRSLDASLRHFPEKLLLLKDEMNTEAAKKLAAERHHFMEIFLDEYARET